MFWGSFEVMKQIQKYFLALVPPPDILQTAHEIKVRIREEFGIKYALKSPPHITLKMPFSYNEAKEGQLTASLTEYLKTQASFKVQIGGVGSFGNRVIFLSIQKTEPLIQLQKGLKLFCKRNLHLVDELSDRNFHPHMTIAFKDVKPRIFEEVLARVREQSFDATFLADHITLLKRAEGRWLNYHSVEFGGKISE
jgi:2'-5' RNA ligase